MVGVAEVPVNPNSTGLGPDTIQFSGLSASVGAFTETINASTRVGYGDIARPFNFPNDVGQSYIIYQDKLGGLSSPYPVPALPSLNAVHRAAILAPLAEPASVSIPGSTIPVPTISVSVPLEQRLAVKAFLHLGAAPLSTPRFTHTDGFDSALAIGPVTVMGSIAQCLEWHPTNTVVTCRADGSPDYQVVLAGVQVPSFVPRVLASPPDRSWGTLPTCTGCVDPTAPDPITGLPSATGAPIGNENSSVLTLGCPTAILGVPTNLCDGSGTPAKDGGFMTARVNSGVFGDPQGRFPLWRQDHVDADVTGDSCPNGRGLVGSGNGQPKSVSATVQRVADNTVPTDGAGGPLVAGTYRPFNAQGSSTPVVRLVDASVGGTGATEASDNNTISDTSDTAPAQWATDALSFAITSTNTGVRGPSDGHYYVLGGQVVDSLGVSAPAPGGSANVWQRDGTLVASGGGATGSVVLVDAVMMRQPAAASGFAYRTTLLFQATVNYAC
jgi:hypothetical protein